MSILVQIGIAIVITAMIIFTVTTLANDKKEMWLVETNCTPTSMYTPATVNYPPQRIYDCEGAELRAEE